MSAFASLNGAQVTLARVAIPYYGTWSADVVLALPDTIATLCTLVLGNLSLTGYAFRTASFSGSRSARLIGGFGGWRNKVTARAYQNPGGVRLSMVLGDAATEVGEKLSLAADASVGTDFVREAAPASRLLRQLGGPHWYIDASGTTHVGAPRPSNTITSDFQVIKWSGSKGRFTVATEDLASWMPGGVFSAPTVSTPQKLSLVTIVSDEDGTLRVEALAA